MVSPIISEPIRKVSTPPAASASRAQCRMKRRNENSARALVTVLPFHARSAGATLPKNAAT